MGQELAENLSTAFKRNYKPNILNPAGYLSAKCFEYADDLRDKLGQFDPKQFSFSEFGDELIPKNDNNTIGIKRSGMELDGPLNKKRKLNDENENNSKQENDIDSN